jgi:hypothetical protein
MARFGLFDGMNKEASQEYEGDEMLHKGDYVEISTGNGENNEIVAIIRLSEGQSVKKIK